MATELATAYVSLVPSFHGVQGAIAQGLAPVPAAADKIGKKSGQSFAGGMKASVGKIGGLLAAGFAAVKVKDFLGSAIDEARESQKVGALTTQVIKSTGGAANVTASQVGKLASAISAKAGVDDEAVQSGSNLLLTFKNVRNEVGKGNQIFNRATQAAVDLSAAGFGSISSTSKQLGKALNDPIKGIAALGRAGVTFTESQQKQIKAMVKQGDLLGAQKIILKEVESQVGGAAAASATAGDKLAVSWANFKETIGTALLPILDRLANFISGKVLPGLLKLGPVLTKAGAFIRDLFSRFSSDGDQAGGRFAQFLTTVRSVWANVRSIFASAISIVQSLWATFGSTIVTYLQRSLSNVLTILRGTFNVIAGVFKLVAAILKGDWSGAWDAIKQILSGAVTILRGLVNQLWAFIRYAFGLGIAAIKGIFGGLWSTLKSQASKGIGALVSAVKGIPGKLKALGGIFKNAGKSLIDAFLGGLSKAGGVAADFARAVGRAVRSVINKGIDKLNSLLEFKIPVKGLPDIHVNPPDLGHIPALAQGGIVRRPTLALLGEAGREAVVPLEGENGRRAAAGMGLGGGVELHVYPQPGQSETDIGRAAADRLLFAMAR